MRPFFLLDEDEKCKIQLSDSAQIQLKSLDTTLTGDSFAGLKFLGHTVIEPTTCCGTAVQAVSGVGPRTIWFNGQLHDGSRGVIHDHNELLHDHGVTCWEKAKFVFLDCDGVITATSPQKEVGISATFPPDLMQRVVTTPRYSGLLFDWRKKMYSRAVLKMLQDWQEEDPDVYFVMATAHMAKYDASAFRDVLFYPLRVIGCVYPRNISGIMQWVDKHVFKAHGVTMCHYACLDDDESNFQWRYVCGSHVRKDIDGYSRSLVHIRGGLASTADMASAKRLLARRFPTKYEEAVEDFANTSVRLVK